MNKNNPEMFVYERCILHKYIVGVKTFLYKKKSFVFLQFKNGSNAFLHWRFRCDEHESAAENEELKH